MYICRLINFYTLNYPYHFVDCMVGDVNMFLTKEVEEGDEKGGSSSYHSAEIEIMIAGI